MICDSNCFFTVFDGLLLSKDQRICYGCIGELERVVVPDSVEEICACCFSWCERLSRVAFGKSSSLKLIGRKAFRGTDVVEIHIPDGVGELCEKCFHWCERLSRVTFGASSSLKLIGERAFLFAGLWEIHCPVGVERLLRDRGHTCIRGQCLVRPLGAVQAALGDV